MLTSPARTRNVDRLTSRPSTALTAMAAMAGHVYSKPSSVPASRVPQPIGSNAGTSTASMPAAIGEYSFSSCAHARPQAHTAASSTREQFMLHALQVACSQPWLFMRSFARTA